MAELRTNAQPLSEESCRSHLRVWRSYSEAGTGTKHTYNCFGEVDMKKSISVTGSQVEAALAAIESVMPTRGLASHEQTVLLGVA